MAFPPGFLDEIKARVSLVDVVGRSVQLRQKSRGDFWGLSPFNTEKTPSFHVREDQGFYHCFASGEHGDLFTFLMKTEGLSFPEAVEQMAELAGLEVPKATPEQAAREKKRHSLYEVTEAACRYYQKALRRPEGREALDYLKSRGLSDETIAEFRLGYSPNEGSGLWQAMKDEGIDMDLLVEAGIYRRSKDGRPPYAFFRDRVMFPIADKRGRVIAFGGRFMGDAKAAGIGKYINSPDTPLFDKGRTLYNHAQARKAVYDGQPLIVAEGYMDVIALSQAGWAGGVAPLGTAMTEVQIAELWKMDSLPYVCFDGDAAGRMAASRASDRALPQLQPGKSLRLLFMPEGEDPDSLIQAKGPSAIQPFLDAAQPLDQFLWQRELAVAEPTTPEMRADLERRLFSLADGIEDETVKKHYRRGFSDKLWNHLRAMNRAANGKGRFGRTYGGAKGKWQEAEPRGEVLKGQVVKELSRRTQQIVLAALINHPGVIDQFFETLDRIHFDADLDKICRELQKISSSGETLDVEVVTTHFSSRGDDALLRSVLSRQVYDLARQAGPQSTDAEASDLLEHLLMLQTQDHIADELRRRDMSGAERLTPEEREARVLAFRRNFDEGEHRLSEGDDEF
ncbi:DNA primase [Aestuariispira ectoiniformans]|uniref:DNA primase n=1 Tax=Aestuariispira ectoiniformans TaxID=2775080 RepID=UPI00223BC9FB|nr:DNA primase [Aestuariispira ectoiniformans]